MKNENAGATTSQSGCLGAHCPFPVPGSLFASSALKSACMLPSCSFGKAGSPGSPPVQIRYPSCKAFDLVVLAANIAGLGPDEDADPGERSTGFPKLVLDDCDRLRFAVNVDGDAFLLPAVHDAVSLNPVPVRRKCLVPATKVYAGLATSPDVIITNEVV